MTDFEQDAQEEIVGWKVLTRLKLPQGSGHYVRFKLIQVKRLHECTSELWIIYDKRHVFWIVDNAELRTLATWFRKAALILECGPHVS
jgi:hypothetical protein